MEAIDVFNHILPPVFYEACTANTKAQYHMLTRALKLPAMSELSARVEVMRRFPGYRQLLNLVGPGVEYFADETETPRLSALGNDELARMTRACPELFPGFIAGIPMNNIPASLDEIRRAAGMGAKGIQLYCHMNGEAIDTARFWPIYELCETLELPILLHPVGGLKQPEYVGEASSKYELWWTIGWPYQTTVAAARLVYSGIFEDFPRIKIVLHHVGAMLPMLAGRLENGLKMYGGRTGESLRDALTRTKISQPHIDSFKKFYADTAAFGSAAAIRCGIEFFGTEHLLFATDMPFDPERGTGYIDRTLRDLDALGLDEQAKVKILCGNAKVLFKL